MRPAVVSGIVTGHAPVSVTQRCNIVSNGSNIVPTLQRCVVLKIVVASRPV